MTLTVPEFLCVYVSVCVCVCVCLVTVLEFLVPYHEKIDQVPCSHNIECIRFEAFIKR